MGWRNGWRIDWHTNWCESACERWSKCWRVGWRKNWRESWCGSHKLAWRLANGELSQHFEGNVGARALLVLHCTCTCSVRSAVNRQPGGRAPPSKPCREHLCEHLCEHLRKHVRENQRENLRVMREYVMLVVRAYNNILVDLAPEVCGYVCERFTVSM